MYIKLKKFIGYYRRKVNFMGTSIKNAGGSKNKISVASMNATAKMGLSLLELESYFEAEMFFKDCVDENSNNGVAWLGLLCAKLKDKTLYAAFTSMEISEQISVKNHAKEIVTCMEELTCAVEYAVSGHIAENILEYLFCLIQDIIDEKKLYSGIDKIFAFTVQYNSKFYDQLLEYMGANIETIASICSALECESIYNDLLKYTLYENVRIRTIEKIIVTYSKAKNFSSAAAWNDRLLEIDSVNLDAILRKLCFSVGAVDATGFKNKQLNCSVSDVIIPFVQKSIEKLSKANVDKLLNFIADTELFCMDRNSFDRAEIYFDFLCKYQFPAKTEFLEKHKSYIKRLASANRTAFFEKYMKVMSNKSMDWIIKNRLKYADSAKASRFFGCSW